MACSKPPVEPTRKKMILTGRLGRLGLACAAALALASLLTSSFHSSALLGSAFQFGTR